MLNAIETRPPPTIDNLSSLSEEVSRTTAKIAASTTASVDELFDHRECGAPVT